MVSITHYATIFISNMFPDVESPYLIAMGVQIAVLEIISEIGNHVKKFMPLAVVGTVRSSDLSIYSIKLPAQIVGKFLLTREC